MVSDPVVVAPPGFKLFYMPEGPRASAWEG